jgi:hypothetical protein
LLLCFEKEESTLQSERTDMVEYIDGGFLQKYTAM